MSEAMRVLLLEDSAADAELVVRALRRAGFEFECQRVDTAEAFAAALDADLDLILADYRLPQFDGRCALELVRERGLDVPFILVTGTLGDELAVECIKQGATDFVLKDRIERLAPAIQRALEERRVRAEYARAEAELRAARVRLQVALEASNLGPWDWNLETNAVYFSPEWKRQIGYADAEIPGEFAEWESRLHPGDHDRILAAVQAYLADPSVGYDVQFRLRHKDGSFRWIQTGARLIRDDAGKATRMIGCNLDITEQKEAALEREQLTEKLRSILESTGEGIYGVDQAGRCTFINGAGAAMLGWPASEIVGKDMHALAHHTRRDESPYPAAECPIERVRMLGTPHQREGEVFWRRDGTPLPVAVSSYPMRKEDVVNGAVVTFADVTEKAALEEQLRQSQKLEAIGQLTSGVAHDFNNLITAVLGFAEIVEESLEPGDQRRLDVQEIQTAGKRAAHLTRQLLAFSRKQVLEPTVSDLNALVTELGQMLRRLIGEQIELQIQLAPDLSKTRVDLGQVQQVILNLAVNARDAMPQGGTIRITTANMLLDPAAAARNPDVAPGAYVALAVTDTGTGMDDATMKRIFEPFFTTKPRGKGTGLGLSTVYGIVKQSGGFVRVDSAVGRGSSFTICLPATQEDIASATPVVRPASRGHETILVVEDDAAVRALARRMLGKAGYRVIEADGPPGARIAAAVNPDIDLLLTDVLMPGGTGPELYRDLAAGRPGLRVVFMSGHSDDIPALGGLLNGRRFLEKPFAPEGLTRKVREALDARTS